MQTVSEYILEMISSYDVTEMFGVPGYANYPFYAATDKFKNMKTVLARHEGGASWMALGYALGGKPFGVCTGTSGAGTTNIVSGVVAAYANSVPMLVLTGQVETTKIGRGAFQELSGRGSRCPDVHGIFKCMTKYSETIWNPSSCEQIVTEAFQKMLSGRMGPVHLNVPLDVQRMPMVSFTTPEQHEIETRAFDTSLVEVFSDLFNSARNPMVLVGRGCRLSTKSLEVFLNASRVPYVTSIQAKGLVPENSEQYFGVLGVSGSLRANQYFNDYCDLLICLGSSLNEFTTNSFSEKMNTVKMVRVDVDSEELKKYNQFSLSICSDVEEFFTHANVYLGSEKREKSFFATKLEPIKKPPRYGNSEKISPVEIVECVEEWASSDTLFTADSGNNAVWVVHYLTLKDKQRFFIDINTGCMGSGIVSAIGFQFANRNRPIVALCGDGGFMMNGMEVAVAVENNLNITWIVFNDSKLGMVAQGALAKFNLDVGSNYTQSNIAAMASAMGAHAYLVNSKSELKAALQARGEQTGPCVIDVRFDDSILPDVYVRAQRTTATNENRSQSV